MNLIFNTGSAKNTK